MYMDTTVDQSVRYLVDSHDTYTGLPQMIINEENEPETSSFDDVRDHGRALLPKVHVHCI